MDILLQQNTLSEIKELCKEDTIYLEVFTKNSDYIFKQMMIKYNITSSNNCVSRNTDYETLKNFFEFFYEKTKLDIRDSDCDEIPILPNLQTLYCENNKLTSLPILPNLQNLFCENNKLTSLPILPNLQTLYCENNLLKTLPILPNLQTL
jgi:Leucine-rich repeat (LRR) protein